MSGFEDAVRAAEAVTASAIQEISQNEVSSALEEMSALVSDPASQIESAFDVDRGAASDGMALLSAPLSSMSTNTSSIQTLNPQDMLDNIIDFERRLTNPTPGESISDTAGDIAKQIDDWSDIVDGPDSDYENLMDTLDGLKDVAEHAVGYITSDNAIEREWHYQGMRIGLNKAVRNFDELI